MMSSIDNNDTVSRIVMYSLYANLVLVVLVFIFAFDIINKQDKGITRLNELYSFATNLGGGSRHISCTEVRSYFEEVDVEVSCNGE